MALSLALILFQHLIDGFHNRDLRQLVADLPGITAGEYTTSQMTYDLRRLSESPLLPAIVRIALPTGMRSGEILSLTWNQVNLVNRVITVGTAKTSSGTGRTTR